MDFFSVLLFEKLGYCAPFGGKNWEALFAASVSAYPVTTITGTLPLTFSSKGGNLTDYLISGNTVQDGTPTPEAPVDVIGCGVRTGNLCPPINSAYGWVIGFRRQNDGSYVSNNVNYEWLSPFFKLSDFGTSFTISADPSTASDSMSVYYYNGDSFIGATTSTNYIGSVFNNIPNRTTRFCFAIRAVAKTESEQIASGWRVWVNAGSTALPYEPYGYKLPIACGGVTKNIYIGNYPLNKSGNVSDDVQYSTQTLTRRVDPETLEVLATPTTEQITVPQIPTTAGTNTLTVGTTVQPSQVSITGNIKPTT